MKPSDVRIKRRPLIFSLILLLTLSLTLSFPATASVIPPQPVIKLTLESEHADNTMTVYADWSLHGNPDLAPPDRILITLKKQPGGTTVQTLEIAPDPDAAPGDQTERHFRGQLDKTKVPDGTYVLIATDPVSGAGRSMTMTFQSDGASSAGKSPVTLQEPVFFLASGLVLIVLLIVIAALMRNKNGNGQV
jgi:hypothetical protein